MWLWGWLGAIAGVALQLQQAILWSGLAYGALGMGCLALLLAVWRWRQHASPRGALVCLCVAALGCMFALTGERARQQAEHSLPVALENQDLYLTGTVTDLPRRRPHGLQFSFQIEEAQWQGATVALPLQVQLSWWTSNEAGDVPSTRDVSDPPQVQAGQRWQLWARLQRPHGLANPTSHGMELWLWEQDLQATGRVRVTAPLTMPELLPDSVWSPIAQVREILRTAIARTVSDSRAAGVLAALVVGDQAAISSTDWDVFRLTGISHLISISGMHVTMFALLAARVVGLLARQWARVWPGLLWRFPIPVLAAWGGVLLSLIYAWIAGWGVPAQRTVLMLALLTALRAWGLRWPWPMALLVVMWVVLLLDPWAWLQPGFWLSFVAVAVLLASSWLGGAVEAKGAWAALRDMLRTQWVVSVALTPLSLLFFGQFSLVGLLANLLAVPWVTLCITPLAMLGVLYAPLWHVGAWAVQSMVLVLEHLAQVSWAAVERPTLPLTLSLLAGAGAVLLVWRVPVRLHGWGLCLCAPLFGWMPARPVWGQFELVAPDVGQGSAVVVRTARHTLVHDVGPGRDSASAAKRVLLPLLRAGGDVLHAVVASHNDVDHVGGLPVLLQPHPHVKLWASYDTRPALGRSAQPCVAGEHWSWDGVEFTWLHPPASPDAAAWSDNARSCVLKITSHATAGASRVALLTGDITATEEAHILNAYPDLKVDVLLAPHHGSASASSGAWLDALQPQHIIVQSGFANRFQHPEAKVVQRYEARGIRWYNSPQCGAATWRSAQPEQVVCWRQVHRRYWHDQVPVAF